MIINNDYPCTYDRIMDFLWLFFSRQTLERTITHNNCKRGAAARSVRARWCHASKVPAHINISACGYVRASVVEHVQNVDDNDRDLSFAYWAHVESVCTYICMRVSRRHGRDWFSLIGSLFSRRRHMRRSLVSRKNLFALCTRFGPFDDKIIRAEEIQDLKKL